VKQWRSFVPKRESGHAVLEYALVLALVAASLLVGLLLFRSSVGNAYGRVAHQVQTRGPRGAETGAVGAEADSGGGAASPRPDARDDRVE
jgi:Flp pilus assembly pilin Flp